MDIDLIQSHTILIYLYNIYICPVFTPELHRALPYSIRLWTLASRINYLLSLLFSYNNLLLTINLFIAFLSLLYLLSLLCYYLLILFPSFRLEFPGPHEVLEYRRSLKEPLYSTISLKTLPFSLYLANSSLILQLSLQYKSNFTKSTKS